MLNIVYYIPVVPSMYPLMKCNNLKLKPEIKVYDWMSILLRTNTFPAITPFTVNFGQD